MDKNTDVVLRVIASIALVFGLLTVKSGGEVLFVDGAGRDAAGNFVSYVVLFNFIMGFLYILAGIGLWLKKPWSVWLSFMVAGATLIVFAVFGLHIYQGGLFEQRTVGAMVLRLVIWAVISLLAYRQIKQR